MVPTDLADVELLERARAGDHEAFRALVSYWGKSSLGIAYALTGDVRTAHAALREAFLHVWRALPATHSQAAFRPLLLGAIADAAKTRAPAEPGTPLQKTMAGLDEQTRVIAVLAASGYPPAEIALALRARLVHTIRATRAAVRTLEAVSPGARDLLAVEAQHVDVAAGFFETAIRPHLSEQVELEVRRRITAPAPDAWRALIDPASVASWMGEQVRIRPHGQLAPGTRITNTAGRTREDHSVTRVLDGAAIHWTTRSRAGRAPVTVEHRWSVAIEPRTSGSGEIELVHRLHGHAFPPGPAGRRARTAEAKRSGAAPAGMHRRLERIAKATEAGARDTAL